MRAGELIAGGQELVGGAWLSLSDWDSQALLPGELCRSSRGLCPGCRAEKSSVREKPCHGEAH